MPTEPSPFQRQPGTVRGVIAPATLLTMTGRRCEEIAGTNPAFAGTRFAPRDFRRLFATDIVDGGLPIHIGAAPLGQPPCSDT